MANPASKRCARHHDASVSAGDFRIGDVSALLAFTSPIRVAIAPQTFAVEVLADLSQASLVWSATDAASQGVFAATIATLWNSLVGAVAASAMPIVPAVSLVGPVNGPVSEIQLTKVDLAVLQATSPHPAGIALGAVLSGTSVPAQPIQNFLNVPQGQQPSDYSVIVGNKVCEAIVAYRWRVGDYPRSYLGDPIDTSYKDEKNNSIPVQVTPRWLQSIVSTRITRLLPECRRSHQHKSRRKRICSY